MWINALAPTGTTQEGLPMHSRVSNENYPEPPGTREVLNVRTDYVPGVELVH